MANTTFSNPAAALGEAARFGEIRSRILFLIGALVVYRIGTYIPVPGVNPVEVAHFFGDKSGTILGIVNLFSGGALSRLSIFAMGVMPYISASIIIQMMSMVVPTLMELRKEGESGRRKITEYTRYGTVILAAFQSFAAAGALEKGGMTLVTGWGFLIPATITMTTGTMFLMWLGEQITERGIGNGISMIILSGIVAGLPGAVGNTIDQVSTGEMQGPFALLLFPATLASFAGTGSEGWFAGVAQDIAAALGYGQPLHLTLYALLIIFFCFFYTALVFNARDTADNLKKSGAFVRGIRPGQQTADYIDQVLTRLTLWGALYVAAVCLLPEFLISSQGVPFRFGGTSLLIVVVVVMDFMAQLNAHMMSHHYPGLLKKANLLGYGRGGQQGG